MHSRWGCICAEDKLVRHARLVAGGLAEIEELRRLDLSPEVRAEIEAEQEVLRHLLDQIEERAFAGA